MHRLVYLTYLIMVGSAGVTFVFLEDFEREFGLSSLGIGIIAALGFITAVISSIAISPLGDRGLLKELGIAGFVTTIAGNIMFALSSELWSLSLSRALTGIGVGLFSIAGRKALIGESTDGSGEKIGQFISAAVAGFILGPIFGSVLSEFGGIPTPFFALSAMLALIAHPTMSWLKTVPVAVSNTADAGSMLSLLRLPGVRAAVATQLAIFFNIGVFDATVDEYLTDLGVSNAGVGLAIAIVGLPLVVIPRLAGRYVDNIPRPADLLLISLGLFVPIIITLGIWTGVVVFVSLAFLQTTLESVLFPTSARVVINESGADHSATGTGLLEASGSLAAAFSALVAPIAYDWTDGPLGSFGMSGAFAALMLVLAWVSIKQRDRADLAFELS